MLKDGGAQPRGIPLKESLNPFRGEKIKTVVDYITSLGSGAEFRFSDVVKATGVSRSTVLTAIQKLMASGKVEKIAKGTFRVK